MTRRTKDEIEAINAKARVLASRRATTRRPRRSGLTQAERHAILSAIGFATAGEFDDNFDGVTDFTQEDMVSAKRKIAAGLKESSK